VKIAITGRHLGVTESMKAYAREKVEKLERYFDRVTQARVTMDIEGDDHRVEILLDVIRGVSLVGKADAPDMYAALDLAEQKLSQQVRRFNQRLKDHHRGGGRAAAAAGAETPAARGPDGGGAPLPDDGATYEDIIDELREGGQG
jgi:ribosomal subunit interface protein